ncbi:MAG: FeoC-like transcriptional regulator [Desulfobulbus sp.]|nr:FeoC-like transcriptional regulator [Desulfobulbus sp.]
MDLIQLKHYLRSRKITPLQDAAHHFQVDVETIRPLCEIWINKGKIRRRMDATGACKGCCKCDPATIEMYEWLD